MNTLGVSGSTIMSDAEKFKELFEYGLNHIEIGEFKNKRQFKHFKSMLHNSLITLGIHVPILRHHSKYDFIDKLKYTPKQAMRQLKRQAKVAKKLGAKYVLVHFPFFVDETYKNPHQMIEEGLKTLCKIQSDVGIPIVAEPKLGPNLNKSPYNIKTLHTFPVETWRKYGIKLCIDLGDYAMATSEQELFCYISKWSDCVGVVHLHNVDYVNDRYYWKPMHPNDESDGHHNLEYIVKHLASLDSIYFVLEHTPHMGYSLEYVTEGVEYVKALVERGVR